MTYRKKLIEVALPLDAINDASAYDKMPGIGPHPKGIHHWWARLPLPCARALLFASLVDDPSSDPAFADKPDSVQDEERDRLFDVIRALVQKKVHEKPEVFIQAHKEIVRCCGDKLPTVLDPFSGGGSIPLEAQRLGLTALGSDLNPIAVVITKAMLEIIPKFAEHAPVNPETRNNRLARTDWTAGRGLADDVRYYGNWMFEEAFKRIGYLYPKVKLPEDKGGGESNIVAWLWARTVCCPNPACQMEVPLVRSFRLASKKDYLIWIESSVDRSAKRINFEVIEGEGPVPAGTIRTRKGATCLESTCANSIPGSIPFSYIRDEGKAGRIKVRLMAVAAAGRRGKIYLSPTEDQERIASMAQPTWLPDSNLPEKALGFRIQAYGITKHRDLFTSRQLAAMTTLTDLVKEVRLRALEDSRGLGQSEDPNDDPLCKGGNGITSYADAIAVFLAFAIDRSADFNNSFCTWGASNEKVMHLFGSQKISMVWDFAEANILNESVGGWSTCFGYVADCLEVVLAGFKQAGEVHQLDAANANRSNTNVLISTDPPYYDNIGYSDLSDFFYIWLRRSIGSVYPDIFSTLLVPKQPELVAAPERFDNDAEAAKQHFETGFRKAFTAIKAELNPAFPMTVYYAFKQAESEENAQDDDGAAGVASTGWETMLQALISTGFQITGTWPVRASQAWRMRSMGSNALASYIVLACRARYQSASLATRGEFLRALKQELPVALKKLQHGNIAPVDLAQASIGPGMSVFSRYSKVVESDGSPMRVRPALQLINQVLDEVLAEQETEYDAETRWAVAWFEQFGMNEGAYGTAETLSKAKNTSVTGMDEAGVTTSHAGKVRLMRRDELPDDWDPSADGRLTVWEVAQHLIRALDTGGDAAAARLFTKVGGLAEVSRDLAYRLYNTSERKGWTQEALAYNSLVVAWPEIKRVAALPAIKTNESLFE